MTHSDIPYIVHQTGRMEPSTEQAVPFWWSSRMGLTVMGFLGFLIFHSLQVNVNTATLDAMTQQHNTTSIYSIHGQEDVATRMLETDSFYWGYIVTQFPGALLSRRYGPKNVIGWSMMCTAIATLLTPVAASIHPGVVIAMRVIGGLLQGVVWPSMQVLLACWVPPSERSTLSAFVYSGTNLGYIVSFFLCRAMCDPDWIYTFQIIGAAGVVWFIVWLYVVNNSPEAHPRITDEEREFIIGSLQPEIDVKKEIVALPWREIITCRPVWAIVVANMCCAWGNSTLNHSAYEFIEDLYRGDNSPDIYTWLVAVTVPYVGFWMVTNGSGVVADSIRRRHTSIKVTTAVVRKVFNCVGCVLPALCSILVAHLVFDRLTSLIIAALGVSMMGCQYGSGYIVNQLDLAPRHAGTIMGISNTLGALSGYLALVFHGQLTLQDSVQEGQITLGIAAIIYVLGAVCFIVFGSSDVPSWALQLEEGPVLETHIRPRRPHEEEAEIL